MKCYKLKQVIGLDVLSPKASDRQLDTMCSTPLRQVILADCTNQLAFAMSKIWYGIANRLLKGYSFCGTKHHVTTDLLIKIEEPEGQWVFFSSGIV